MPYSCNTNPKFKLCIFPHILPGEYLQIAIAHWWIYLIKLTWFIQFHVGEDNKILTCIKFTKRSTESYHRLFWMCIFLLLCNKKIHILKDKLKWLFFGSDFLRICSVEILFWLNYSIILSKWSRYTVHFYNPFWVQGSFLEFINRYLLESNS